MIYEWTDGARIGIDAQAAGERLAELHQQHNAVTAGLVVRDARRKRSPLHDAFEWDDLEAAEQHRLEQARRMLRGIRIVSSGEVTAPQRAYVVVTEAGENHYTSVERALSSEDLRQQVLNRALKELDSWRQRYREYEELAELFTAIEAGVAGL